MPEPRTSESGKGGGNAASKDRVKGNVSQEPDEAKTPRGWTQEEMDEAAPMPVPEIPEADPD